MKKNGKKDTGALGNFFKRFKRIHYPIFWMMTGAIFVITLFILNAIIFNWDAIFGLLGFFLLAFLLAGILTGELLRVIFPHKDLLVYENGIEFVSKKGSETYHWRRFETINVRVIKSKQGHTLIGYAYHFSLSNGKQIYIGMTEYPELGQYLADVLAEYAPDIVTFRDVLQ